MCFPAGCEKCTLPWGEIMDAGGFWCGLLAGFGMLCCPNVANLA